MNRALHAGLELWDVWRGKSVNRKIFTGALTVGVLTMVVKACSFGKEVVAAHQFGTSDALDAFLIAFLLPSFAVNLVAGSFNAAIIPTFVQVRETEGLEASHRLFSSIMVLSIALLGVITVLLALGGPFLLPLLGSGFDVEKIALTRHLFYVVLPVLFFGGLANVWTSILNAGERFALAAAAPTVTPILTVAMLLVGGRILGIYALALGMVCGLFLEALLLMAALKKRGFSVFPRWNGMNAAIGQVIRQYAPMLAGTFLMSSTYLVDQAMAAMLPAGSVSMLNYGNKIVASLVGILSLAIGTAIFPHFSRMVALTDIKGIKHTLKTYIGIAVFICAPLTLFLVFLSELVVEFIFERGAFTAADTRMVAKVQAMYVLQLTFHIAGIVLVRLISAMKGNWILMLSAIISLPLNIVFNLILMKTMGVSGIALSTSLVYAVSLIFLSVMTLRLTRRLKA